MRDLREDLIDIYRYFEILFDSFYLKTSEPYQTDSVFDDIFRSVELALRNESSAIRYEIEEVIEKWKQGRDEHRKRGACMNREAIKIIKREVLAAIRNA